MGVLPDACALAIGYGRLAIHASVPLFQIDTGLPISLSTPFPTFPLSHFPTCSLRRFHFSRLFACFVGRISLLDLLWILELGTWALPTGFSSLRSIFR